MTCPFRLLTPQTRVDDPLIHTNTTLLPHLSGERRTKYRLLELQFEAQENISFQWLNYYESLATLAHVCCAHSLSQNIVLLDCFFHIRLSLEWIVLRFQFCPTSCRCYFVCVSLLSEACQTIPTTAS